MTDWKDAVTEHMGGHGKPAKEIAHIKSYKSKTKGDVIHEHHHTHPEHHPMEEHTTRGDDELANHAMANMGTPNEGESASDPAVGAPATDPAAVAGAPAPAPMGSGAAAPMAGV